MMATQSSRSRCMCKHGCGSSRSLVRRIGSSLPIGTGRKIFIRVPDSPAAIRMENEFRYEATGQRYVSNEEGLTLASYINNPRKLFGRAVGLLDFDPDEGVAPAQHEGEEGGEDMDEVGVADDNVEMGGRNQEAIEKISALESELAQLKAQIAMYALAEGGADEEATDSSTFQAPPPPPPPLPPPPPPATPAYQRTLSSDAITSTPNIVSASTGEDGGPQIQPSAPIAATPVGPPTAGRGQPDMGDVLQGIGSVRLRAVANMARSPGGTPLRPKNSRGGRGAPADPNDPASIIAQALRKKFSHKVFKDSPDKENLDRSDASLNVTFESPTAKLLK